MGDLLELFWCSVPTVMVVVLLRVEDDDNEKVIVMLCDGKALCIPGLFCSSAKEAARSTAYLAIYAVFLVQLDPTNRCVRRNIPRANSS